MPKIRKLLCNHAHYAVAKGTPAQNLDYCTKEDTRDGNYEPFVFGNFATTSQGTRTDILRLRDAIMKDKRKFVDIAKDDSLAPTAAKFMRFTERLEVEVETPVPRPDVHVTFHYGKPGMGKTHCCKSSDPDTYMFDGQFGDFWEGYKGQKRVILDEFTGRVMKPTTLNRILDKYPYAVNIKGKHAAFLANDIHITSNYLPDTWWNTEKTQYCPSALERRIHEVHWHKEDPKGKAKYYYRRYVTDDTKNAMTKFKEDYAKESFVPTNQKQIVINIM